MLRGPLSGARVALPLVLAIGCVHLARADSWTVRDQSLGGINGRVAVIVDAVLGDPELNGDFPPFLAMYVADLALDGYSYTLATFAGSVTELRGHVKGLYNEAGVSLDGVVLLGGGLPWARYAFYPWEAYLMDIDDEDADWLEYPPGSGRLHAWPGDHQAQIWVSRVKADHLPEIVAPDSGLPANEKDIIETYLLRNHEWRWNAFNPQQRALAYYSSQELLQQMPEDPSSAMLAAFGFVKSVFPGEASYEDYTARLARQGPDPAPYDFIYELGSGGHTWHDPDVWGSDYVDAQSKAMGICLDSDGGGDFSWVPYGDPGSETDRGCVAADACFGLTARTLVVSASASDSWWSAHPYALWTRVGAARSYGDGYRAQFNLYGCLGMVLLGDGSIKGTSYDWTGGAGTLAWTDAGNWAGGLVPGSFDSPDRVRIDGVEVEVTDAPPEVWSIDLRSGAGLTISDAGTELWSHTSLIGESPATNTLHMKPRTNLYLGQGSSGLRGSLVNLNILMDDTTDGSTYLSAEHAIEDCTGISIGTNCYVDVANMRRCSTSPIRGTLTVDNLSHCRSGVTVGEGGAINAGLVFDSVVGVPTGTLSADSVYGCVVTIEEQGELIARGVTGAVTMTGGAATIDQEAYLQLDAANAIVHIGGHAEGPDWNLSDTQLTAGDAFAYGNWTIAGSSPATFTRLSTMPNPTPEYSLSLELANGSHVTIDEVPSDVPTFGDGVQHQLMYAGSANELVAGGGMASEVLYVGDQTRIRGDVGGELALDLSCSLDIASVFMPGGFVASGWDTRQTDVTLGATTLVEQVLELISPWPSSWEQGPNVVFSDVACDAKLRDLVIAAREDDGLLLPVRAANDRDNQPRAGPEAGIYRHVTVGDDRTVDFSAADGYIWWYGAQPTISPSATFYLDGSPTTWYNVIKQVKCTVFGDWNGDGRVTASELSALQAAIAGEPGSYNSMMDGDCSGTLDNADLAKFMGNYGNNLNGSFLLLADPGDDGGLGGAGAAAAEGAGGGAEGAGAGAEPPDISALASWLEEQLSAEQMEAFVAEASATAAETTDAQVLAELTELLSYLE